MAEFGARGGTKLPNDPTRINRPIRVKNKQPAPVQITAEQILREASERQDAEYKPPKVQITDPEELADFRARKRKMFEDNIRKARQLIGNYIKYAQWEESQKEFARARSVYERGLDVDYRNVSIWLKYAEMEMRYAHINHARNIWDRAVTLLPRVQQLWYKYAYMEEMLGNVPGARQIFERWIEWNPDEQAWLSYVKMEMRYGEVDAARRIFEKYISANPTVEAWLRYGKFEERNGDRDTARATYERAVDTLEHVTEDERLFVAFAKFEEKSGEGERARAIYKYALDRIPKHKAQELYKTFVTFEKQYGDREGIDDVIVGKRRFQFEEQVAQNPYNYDTWFDYIRLEEDHGDRDRTRDIFERAIANVPPAPEKRSWKRYMFLWIKYAIYEELDAQDIERARQVYSECLKVVPHKKFTFSKLWVMAAHFEVRQKNLDGARSILGRAIGTVHTDKIFKGYIELELQLGNMDRCRIIYEKYLEHAPANCFAWSKFAELEKSLSEVDRARAIFELGVKQPYLDMPEVLWKAYIDFEIGEEEYDNTRELYGRLLERTKHVKVYVSYAKFEADIGELPRARKIFEKASQQYPSNGDCKDERVMLLEAWLQMEQQLGDEKSLQDIEAKMPKRVKKKRPMQSEDQSVVGWEEYYDYIFPDEKGAAQGLRLLEMAQKWKRQKTEQTDE
jgi:crooked neck